MLRLIHGLHFPSKGPQDEQRLEQHSESSLHGVPAVNFTVRLPWQSFPLYGVDWEPSSAMQVRSFPSALQYGQLHGISCVAHATSPESSTWQAPGLLRYGAPHGLYLHLSRHAAPMTLTLYGPYRSS